MIGVLKGLATTFLTFTRKPVTVHYPDVHHPLPERNRGFPVLLWDAAVPEPFCTGCHACERACPVECMTVVMKDNPRHATGESKRRKIVDKFYIDYARCMRCNICVEVCNFEAIALNNTWKTHEMSSYDRSDLVLDLEDLLAQSRAGDIVPFTG